MGHFRNFITATFFLIVIINDAQSAKLKISQSTLSPLLRQPTVTAIHQDTKGILWVGTQQGLYRFDGANSTLFSSDPSTNDWIPNSNIRDIVEHPDGSLLVATGTGIILKSNWSNGDLKFEKLIVDLNAEEVVGLLVTDSGNTWILTENKLFLYDSQSVLSNNWISNCDIVNYIGHPNAIAEDIYGNISIGGDMGLISFFAESKEIVVLNKNDLSLSHYSRVSTLEPANNNTLYLGTSTGDILLVNLALRNVVARLDAYNHGPTFISSILHHHDSLVIGTDRGLYTTNLLLSSFKNLGALVENPSNPDVYTLFENNRYIWIGTGDGLDVATYASFDLFNMENSGLYNDVFAIGEDYKGEMWIGTYSGLYFYDKNTRSHIQFDNSLDTQRLAEKRVTTIYSRDHELWIGYFQGGVKIFNVDQREFQTFPFDLSDIHSVTEIIGSEDQSSIWIATYRNGLFGVSKKGIQSYYEGNKLPEKSITTLFRSQRNILLAFSEQKIYRHMPNTDQFQRIYFEFENSNLTPIVYSVSQNKNGDVFFGTNGHGVYQWALKDQILERYFARSLDQTGSLSGSIIYGIEIDINGNIWCSTQSGIVKLDPEGNMIKRFTTID